MLLATSSFRYYHNEQVNIFSGMRHVSWKFFSIGTLFDLLASSHRKQDSFTIYALNRRLLVCWEVTKHTSFLKYLLTVEKYIINHFMWMRDKPMWNSFVNICNNSGRVRVPIKKFDSCKYFRADKSIPNFSCRPILIHLVSICALFQSLYIMAPKKALIG